MTAVVARLGARRLIVAGADAGPRGEVSSGRELGHVTARFGDEHLGCAARDACDRAQQLDLPLAKGPSCSSIASERRSIASSRKSMWARIWPTMSACLALKRPSRASLSAGSFLRLAAGELGQHLRIGGARHERVKHRAPGPAEQLRRDRVQLDAGVPHDLGQPVGLWLTVTDLRLAISAQVTQVADRLGRHQARAQQPGLGQAAQPRRVGDVHRATGDLLDVARVDHPTAQSRPRGSPRPPSSTPRWPASPPASRRARSANHAARAAPGRCSRTARRAPGADRARRARGRTPSRSPCAHRAPRRARR